MWGAPKPQPPVCVRGVISPILANLYLYLHYVLDVWIEAWRKEVARTCMLESATVCGCSNRCRGNSNIMPFRATFGAWQRSGERWRASGTAR